MSRSSSFTNNDSAPYFTKVRRETPTQHQRPLALKSRGLENVGEDIAKYLSRTGPTELKSPLTTLNDHVSGQSRLYLPLSHQQHGSHSPGSLCSETLTNESTLSSEMSRQSSTSNDALVGGFAMIHVNSNSSNFDEFNTYALSSLGHAYFGEEQGRLLLGAGGMSQATKYPPTSLHIEGMQRSPSNDSNSSTSSSRSKIQLQRQNRLAAARPLAAKPVVASEQAMSREPSPQSTRRVPSEDGGEERLVQAIPKTIYQRPLHPKVWCKKCDDYPEGFRGEHELRRHTDRQHKVVVKKWICSEPCDGLSGIEHPIPINPLAKCKACSQLKKRYGAYYNAAAHLRRAHFNPKPKGRAKGAKIDGKLAEKRGGKGGGDWPSMIELKRWMREADEFVVENEPQPERDEESEGDCMNIDCSEPSTVPSDTSSNCTALIGSNFLDHTRMLDIYPAAMPNQGDFEERSIQMHPSSNIDIALDMPHPKIDHSTMFFDVQNALLMDDMNDLSFSYFSSSFPSGHQQHLHLHHQHLHHQQHGRSSDFDYPYNM